MDWVILIIAASITALATGLGAIPVFLFRERTEQMRAGLWGVAAGMMGVASVVGLLLPAIDEGGRTSVAIGLLAGIMFMLLTRRWVHKHEHSGQALMGGDGNIDPDSAVEADRQQNRKRGLVVFIVLFIHSLPEGLAIGTAYASDTAGLSLFIVTAIAVHNIPEGIAVAIPMHAAGAPPRRQFWAAVLTSVPQPLAAPLAYGAVKLSDSLLAPSFGFAGGAMLALVVVEMLPEAYGREHSKRGQATAGVVAGGAVMLALSAVLGVQ